MGSHEPRHRRRRCARHSARAGVARRGFPARFPRRCPCRPVGGGRRPAGGPDLDQYRDLIAQETLAFTIAQAVAVTTELHPEVRRNRERLSEYGVLLREAHAPYLPQLDLSLSAARTRDPGFRNSPFFSRLIDDPDAAAGFGGGGDPSAFAGAFTFGTYLWNFQLSRPCGASGCARPPAAWRSAGEIAEADFDEVRNRIARDTAGRPLRLPAGAAHPGGAGAGGADPRTRTRPRQRPARAGSGARGSRSSSAVQLSRLRRQLDDAEEALNLERAASTPWWAASRPRPSRSSTNSRFPTRFRGCCRRRR